jgi:NDP-sugar pyrophosphorylase family protein
MERVTLLPPTALSDGWIAPKYLPEGKDKYYIRNRQVVQPEGGWRHLRSNEIERLVMNNNTASSWDTVWVTDEFDSSMIKDNKFYGTVRIGRVSNGALQYHDLRLPVGITGSSIHSCDIGDDCAIHNVYYMSHYIIGAHCMLFNIQEMSCTDHAKFGNGIVKDDEPENVRVRIEIMNETGVRSVMPFDGMIPADAYLWAKYVDDTTLQERLGDITQRSMDYHRGYYGEVGERCVIKNSSIIKDVKIGTDCYIKGASKLKNITINSSNEEPSQIGENVILVNGIVGYGCRIFYSCTAVKFILGNNSNLKYGARLINSIMGDNSTISCCEVLNNLIFPGHEQHHNNSFLIASVIMGQSNMAAGATIGSNHNSRTNDGELVAGRGFWPGLCSSVKHSSRFASFTLLAKGDYPAEMYIALPFSLVSNNVSANRLEVMPAYWWMYNMYALARNTWKYRTRDKRKTKVQNIEFDTFAPDTMQEVMNARRLLEMWTAKAYLRMTNEEGGLKQVGRRLLQGDRKVVDSLTILGEGMENSRRPIHILKAYDAYHAYGDMLIHYAMSNVLDYFDNRTPQWEELNELLNVEQPCSPWINLGGQLVMETDLDVIRHDICNGTLDTWDDIHHRYDELWARYSTDKLRHALKALCLVMDTDTMSPDLWLQALALEERIQRRISEQVYLSRKKDHDNPFRASTCRNIGEEQIIYGVPEENSFVCQVREETFANIRKIERLRNLL